MARPGKHYHLLSESSKRRRDREARKHQEAKLQRKRELNRICAARYYHSKKGGGPRRHKNDFSIVDNTSSNMHNFTALAAPDDKHPTNGEFDAPLSGSMVSMIGTTSGTKSAKEIRHPHTLIEVLHARLSESDNLANIIKESATKRRRCIDDEATKRQKCIDDEATKRQKCIDDEEKALKNVSNQKDSILQELYKQMLYTSPPPPTISTSTNRYYKNHSAIGEPNKCQEVYQQSYFFSSSAFEGTTLLDEEVHNRIRCPEPINAEPTDDTSTKVVVGTVKNG